MLPLRYEQKMALRSLVAKRAPGFWNYLTGKPTPTLPKPASPAVDLEKLRFPFVSNPDVSIIIPVFGHLRYTMQCLGSLAAHRSRFSFEVIVVDDRSTDETLAWVRGRPGLIVEANETNVGFIASCNRGAARARGRFLVFLNNDTEVMPDWLDELAGTFAVFQNAGLVGSMLLYPDGRLQEAGGLIWRDGSGWNYGRFGDPGMPQYNYLRETDYVGASLAVPR